MSRPPGRRGGGGRGPGRGMRSGGSGGYKKGCRLWGLVLIAGLGLSALAILGTAGVWVASFFV